MRPPSGAAGLSHPPVLPTRSPLAGTTKFSGGGIFRRAAVVHRAAAVRQIRLAEQSGWVASAGPAAITREMITAHESIRSGDMAVVLAASRQWMHSRR